MSPLLRTIGALLRRFGLAAGTGLLACAVAGWPGWAESALKSDGATAAIWPVFWLVAEGVQKYLRESKK